MEELEKKITNSVHDTENKMLPWNSIIIRELLPVVPAFHAFHEMPVTSERRYFVKDGQILCRHPYWPPDSIVSYRQKLPEGWEKKLTLLNEETHGEVILLSAYAKQASAALPGFWSVDFLWSEGRKQWFLIDMAQGERSFHWETCPNCPQDQKEAAEKRKKRTEISDPFI